MSSFKVIEEWHDEFGNLHTIERPLYSYLSQFGDVLPVVRCKDCKHKPSGTGVNHNVEFPDDIEFPDEICPCQCEDYWYSWIPEDDWFCANGEAIKRDISKGEN